MTPALPDLPSLKFSEEKYVTRRQQRIHESRSFINELFFIGDIHDPINRSHYNNNRY